MTSMADDPLRKLGTGGQGYCYDFDRELFAGSCGHSDGPLLVSLDSNVLIDIEQYGRDLFEETLPPSISGWRREQLEALGRLLEAWLVRDIRFLVVPATHDDFKKQPSADRMRARERLFSSIEQALTFQIDDWEESGERFASRRRLTPAVNETLARVPDDLDRRMVNAAWECRSDVFLTMDLHLLEAMETVPSGFPNIWSPVMLAQRLLDSASTWPEPQWLTSGTVQHDDCLWVGGLPFGDTGKWVQLFEAFNSATTSGADQRGSDPSRS